jgi:hypothetical protein
MPEPLTLDELRPIAHSREITVRVADVWPLIEGLEAENGYLRTLLWDSRAEADRCVSQGNAFWHNPDLCERINAILPAEITRAAFAEVRIVPGEITEGGEDDPWRYCPRCCLSWAAEPASFGVRED